MRRLTPNDISDLYQWTEYLPSPQQMAREEKIFSQIADTNDPVKFPAEVNCPETLEPDVASL